MVVNPGQAADIGPRKKKTRIIADRYPLKRGLVGHLGFWLGMTATRLMIKLNVVGKENLPQKTPYVLAANHETYVDGMWIASYLPPRHFHLMSCIAAKDLEDKHGLLGRLIVRVGRAIAVDRYGSPVRGLIIAKNKVAEGNILLVHPEGTRSRDGHLGELKDGAAYIAMKSNVPLVPVFVDGGYEVFNRHMKRPQPRDPVTKKRHRVIIRFGRPLYPDAYKTTKEMTAALNQWMQDSFNNKKIPRKFSD